jgi:hypothetical protein
VQPWGWTWVDNARWGFAPSHYGRWAYWRNSWCWVPGALVARPVYAPALVAWVGGGGWGARVNIGGPSVGWLPLAPRERYVPHYPVSPRYRDRVNPVPPGQRLHEPGQPPRGPAVYGNQGVPNAVTVVPRETLVQRLPLRRGEDEDRQGRGPRQGRDPGPARDDRPRARPEPLAPVAAPQPPAVQADGPQRPRRSTEYRPPDNRPPDGRPLPVPVVRPPPPSPAPAAVPSSPPAAMPVAAQPGAVSKPVVEKPRDAEHERGSRPAAGEERRQRNDRDKEK